ncbi:acetyltransferase, GNAT family protein [Toxoplasma gondii p89]|uniref:Acetyltransferase, GNAT family protein n=1 Tax=Toxoplasma gondii p89 TaxID=943119 RepID=A0A086J8K0_TOXGO|nr:acetyltransferase, GNAT family protein [Toxoplasma gondii p89]
MASSPKAAELEPEQSAAATGRFSSPWGHTSLSSSDLPSSLDEDSPEDGASVDDASPEAARDPRLLAAQTAQLMLAASSPSVFPFPVLSADAEQSLRDRGRSPREQEGRQEHREADRQGGGSLSKERRSHGESFDTPGRRTAAEEAGRLPLCASRDCVVKGPAPMGLAEAGESLIASAAAGFDSLLASSTLPLRPSLEQEEARRTLHASRMGMLLAGDREDPGRSLRLRSSAGLPRDDVPRSGEASGEGATNSARSLHADALQKAPDALSANFPRPRGDSPDSITVRPFRSEDAEAVKQLCYRHFRSLTLPSVCFWICHHSIDLLALFVIALCFISLSQVLLAGLLFFGYLLLRGVWEFEMYIRRDCQDLGDVSQSYMSSKASGFWVAERVQRDPRNPERTTRRLAGCIGLAPLQNDNKTAQLVRLVVDRSLRRQHIGSLLLNTFINYAVQQHYSVVRLYTNNLNNDSIRFAKTKGFELQQVVRRGLMRGDLLKWQKKLEAPGVTQRRSRAFNLPSSILD